MSVETVSHNDYLNQFEILTGKTAGCTIFEVDVIYRHGLALLSHGIFIHGQLIDYFKLMHHKGDALYIELKTSKRAILPLIINLINAYSVQCYISGKNHWYSKRGDNAKFLTNNFKSPRLMHWDEFKKDKHIIYKKLYKNKPWYKKVFHY